MNPFQLLQMMKTATNPMAMVQQLAQNNPQLQPIIEERGQGAKWSVPDIKSVSGIDFTAKDYTLYDFAYAMNMLWSDNCNVFNEHPYYVKMTKNYLEDPDYMGDYISQHYGQLLPVFYYATVEEKGKIWKY